MQYLIKNYEFENRKKDSNNEKLKKIFDEIEIIANTYQWKYLDFQKIKDEKIELESSGINLDDLNIDFELAKEIFSQLDALSIIQL